MKERRRLQMAAVLSVLLALAITLASEQQQPSPPQSQPQQPALTFRTSVDLVAIDVSVVDDNGRPVRGLKSEDFVLTVDGKPRRVASAEFISQAAAPGGPLPSTSFSTNEGVTGGRLIMIVIDQGNIRQGAGQALMSAADRLLKQLLPGDKVALATIPGKTLVEFTSHHALVGAAIGKVGGMELPYIGPYRIGLAEVLALQRNDGVVLREVLDRECPQIRLERRDCMAEIQQEVSVRFAHIRQQTIASLTGLRAILDKLKSVDGPKTMVLVSEGLVIGRFFNDVSWLSTAAAAARVSIYALRLTPPAFDSSTERLQDTPHDDDQLRQEGLETLVGLTRGTIFSVVASADRAFERLALELTGYYLLGLEPEPRDRDGKPHQIKVEVRRRGLAVRARSEFTIVEGAPGLRKAEDVLSETLRAPLLATDVRLKVATFTFQDPTTPKLKVLVSADIGGNASASAPIKALAFTLMDDEGKVAASSFEPDLTARDPDSDQHYMAAVVVDPGTYTLKMAAIDEIGRKGSVEHRFDARLTSAGQFHFGDLMLGTRPAAGSALRPAIDPKSRADDLVAYLELYCDDIERLKSATLTVEVAEHDTAQALATESIPVADTKYEHRRIAQGWVPTTSLPAGNYVARAVVSVAGRPIARLTRPFTVARTAG